MKYKSYLGVICLLILVLPVVVYGKGKGNVYVPSGSSIVGNYYGAGDTVEIAGSVKSDVIVAGGNVIVSGAVGGDVIAAGGNIRITGPVGGNVRVVGGNVEIYGTVARNVMVGSGTLVIGESAKISGQITAGSGTMEIRGLVQGGILAGSGAVILSGEIQGPINLYLDKSGSLDIRETTKTGSSFNYYGVKQAQVASGAQLAEAPQFHEFVTKPAKPVWWWRFLISLFSALVLGMVLTSLIPGKLQEVITEALSNPWRSLGWGALWAFIVPIMVIVLMVTIIGLPLALVLAAIYFIGLILAPIVAGASLGWFIKSKSGEGWLTKQRLLVVVLVGIFIYRLIVFIPFIGGLVGLVGALWAWGAILQVQRKLIQSFR